MLIVEAVKTIKIEEKIQKRFAEKRTGDNLRASSETAGTKRSRKRALRARKRRCLIVELYDSNGLLNQRWFKS